MLRICYYVVEINLLTYLPIRVFVRITGFRKKYMGRILKISPQINSLPDADKLLYLLKGVDTEIINITGEWLYGGLDGG